MNGVFTNGPGDRDSIPGRVILKTQKMELDVSLLYTQHYKENIKGKVKQSEEKRAFGSPVSVVTNFTLPTETKA